MIQNDQKKKVNFPFLAPKNSSFFSQQSAHLFVLACRFVPEDSKSNSIEKRRISETEFGVFIVWQYTLRYKNLSSFFRNELAMSCQTYFSVAEMIDHARFYDMIVIHISKTY